MSEKILKGVSLCRRDFDYNYDKVKDTFIPKKGEICLVDTENAGLCVLVGDGKSTYATLLASGYVNSIFVICYYKDGKFYTTSAFTTEAYKNENKLYIDKNNPSAVYYWNGNNFIMIGSSEVPAASADTAGIMKLYDAMGNDITGTMTQRAITNELNKKFEASVDGETIIFTKGE